VLGMVPGRRRRQSRQATVSVPGAAERGYHATSLSGLTVEIRCAVRARVEALPAPHMVSPNGGLGRAIVEGRS